MDPYSEWPNESRKSRQIHYCTVQIIKHECGRQLPHEVIRLDKKRNSIASQILYDYQESI